MNSNENQHQNNQGLVKIFNAKDLGQSLREVAVELIKTEPNNIESHWFHSAKDADMFLWKDANRTIIKQQLTFYGQLVEWNVVDGVRTGLIIEDESGQKMSSSPLIKYDSSPQSHGVEQAIEIVSYIGGLADEEKAQIVENFTRSPQLKNMSSKEIMTRYGLHSQKPKSTNFLFKLFKALGLFSK